jgi:hypothetical protein
VLNTDAVAYGGSGVGNMGTVDCERIPAHGFPQSILLELPPLAVIYLVPEQATDPLETDKAKEMDPSGELRLDRVESETDGVSVLEPELPVFNIG